MSPSASSRTLALHHIALGARDVEALASFYSSAFSLPELRRHLNPQGELRSIWLSLEGAVLMVEQTDVRRPYVEELQAGAFLLAFPTTSHERRNVEARLLSLGAPPEKTTEFTSYFRDPEGNRVAVSCYDFTGRGEREDPGAR